MEDGCEATAMNFELQRRHVTAFNIAIHNDIAAHGRAFIPLLSCNGAELSTA